MASRTHAGTHRRHAKHRCVPATTFLRQAQLGGAGLKAALAADAGLAIKFDEEEKWLQGHKQHRRH
ncbi:MAG: hypothetical protein ABGY24_04935, partial [bacterium]